MGDYRIAVSPIEDEEMASYGMPYYWGVHRWSGTSWTNAGSGWADTPQKAFEQAYEHYFKLINNLYV